MAHFEIEIKSLLGTKSHADALKERMAELDSNFELTSENKQLNHYFEGGVINELYSATEHLFSGEQHEKFQHMVEKGKDFSVRTRQRDGEVLLVVKASVDEGTRANTVSRLEFEEPVTISLTELDELLLSSGYQYQAKWSREREEYSYKGANVCIDKNAGYGYLAEFEQITDDEAGIDALREELAVLMHELGVVELPQDRLARMFAYYNNNWDKYYGTDSTFTIE